MTSELAKLLDGEVAARFGSVTLDGYPLHFKVDERNPDGAWVDDDYYREVHNNVADALWLAHLLALCGERGWCVTFHDDGKLVCVFTEGTVGYEATCGTRLEALARAMLAVPVTPPPTPAQG